MSEKAIATAHATGFLGSTRHWLEWLSTQLGIIGGALTLIMMLSIVREALGRYLFNAPTNWALESSEYMLLIMVYLGAAYTTLIDGHVRVDLFYERWSATTKKIADVVAYFMGLSYCAVLIWQGTSQALTSLERGTVSSGVMAWPLFPFQMLVPIGSFLMFLVLVGKISGRLRVNSK